MGNTRDSLARKAESAQNEIGDDSEPKTRPLTLTMFRALAALALKDWSVVDDETDVETDSDNEDSKADSEVVVSGSDSGSSSKPKVKRHSKVSAEQLATFVAQMGEALALHVGEKSSKRVLDLNLSDKAVVKTFSALVHAAQEMRTARRDSAYTWFMRDFNRKHPKRADGTRDAQFGDVQKAWKRMSDEAKAPYVLQAGTKPKSAKQPTTPIDFYYAEWKGLTPEQKKAFGDFKAWRARWKAEVKGTQAEAKYVAKAAEAAKARALLAEDSDDDETEAERVARKAAKAARKAATIGGRRRSE